MKLHVPHIVSVMQRFVPPHTHRAYCVILCGVLQACGSSASSIDPGPVDDAQSIDTNADEVIVNNGPEGDSALIIDGSRYPLSSGLGDIWGVQARHYQVDFTITDGNFRLETATLNDETYTYLVPAQASTVLHAKMFSPGSSFAYANYAFVADQSQAGSLDGASYFSSAFVGLDIDGDTRVSEQEQLDVIDGTISFSGTLPDIALSFALTLSTGQSVVGQYTGLFDFTPR